MCLVTKQRKAKIAKKDIVCYKLLADYLSSIYFACSYRKGVLMRTDLQVHKAVKGDMNECFDNSCYKLYYPYTGQTNIISQGFHAALSVKRLKGKGWSIYEFLIPAGSEYFIDKTGLIVSNQIILVNDINLYKP